MRTVLTSWARQIDAALRLDGQAFRPDGKSGATPVSLGLAGALLHSLPAALRSSNCNSWQLSPQCK